MTSIIVTPVTHCSPIKIHLTTSHFDYEHCYCCMASDASPDFRKESISSMIVELNDIVSSQGGNIGKLTDQNTLFSEPAMEGKKLWVSEKE